MYAYAFVAANALFAVALAQQSSSSPAQRWGAASALLGSQFVVHGGKTNGDAPGGGGFTYSSGPNTNELWSLDLSQSFTTASAPWQLINQTSNSQAPSPAVAFHSLSPTDQSDTVLLFGGQPDPSANVQSSNDSAYIVSLSPTARHASYASVPASWDEPAGSTLHAASSDGQGNVYIVGGASTLGSQQLYSTLWTLNTTARSPSFRQAAQPMGGIEDATATLLSDGTLLSIGGIGADGALQSLQTLSYYSPTSDKWSQIETQSSATPPASRRGHVAVALPNKRLLIHGGANADLTSAFSDAWILDWSRNPPFWSELDMTNGPSARYGHSATAYGDKAAFAFGWAANNPADSLVYVFDASSLQISSSGQSSGGQWTTSYTPDPNAGSSGKSNGSSSSGNNGGNSNQDNGGGDSSSAESPFEPSSPTNDNGSSSDGGSSSAGTKAGAALGSLIGLGLVAGVGLYAYRRYQNNKLDKWRDALGPDGEGQLLGGTRHYNGADEFYTLEKAYGEGVDGDGGVGAGAFLPGMHPTGPREPTRLANAGGAAGGAGLSSPWSLNNIGHAMEGSGPHLRQRLALLTGIGMGASVPSNQQRFDMLADEDEEYAVGRGGEAYAMRSKQAYAEDRAGEEEQEDDDDDAEYAQAAAAVAAAYGSGQNGQDRLYGQVVQDDWDDAAGYGDIAGQYGRRGDLFTDDEALRGRHSPFLGGDDDGEKDDVIHSAGPGGAAQLYGHYASRNDMRQSLEDVYAGVHEEVSVPSSESGHTPTAAANIISFSDSNQFGTQRRRASWRNGGGARTDDTVSPSPLIRRSPTWWDKFMGQSFLERTASGRLYTGPRADEPIRDPADPPALDAIREASGHSAYPSGASDPFDDRQAMRQPSAVGPTGASAPIAADQAQMLASPDEESSEFLGHPTGGKSAGTIKSAQSIASIRRMTHGYDPNTQLYIANPDHRRGSSMTTASSARRSESLRRPAERSS